MTKETDKEKLTNFSTREYSYNDYQRIKDYLNEFEKNEEVKEYLLGQWRELQQKNAGADKTLLRVFRKIQYSILLKEKKSLKKRFYWDKYSQAAAILLLPVLAFTLWYYIFSKHFHSGIFMKPVTQGWVEINAPEGARIEFVLPDSTFGCLNSGSRLKYPPVFGRHRNVQLIGEGFFNVNHMESSDFIVSVADLEVKALGTKFDVWAYPDDCHTQVVLQEGSVEVKGKAGIFKEMLSPNEQIIFNRTEKSLKIAEVDAERFTAWKDNFLIIDDEPLGQAIERIERWYNVEIIIKDTVLNNFRFKATFKDEPLEEVLRLIAITTPLNYTVKKRVIDSGGILERKKVIIRLKK